MPFVWVGICAGLFIGLLLTPSDRYIDQWVSECHSKGGAAVHVYTSTPFSTRINCLDVKRVDMRDNTP